MEIKGFLINCWCLYNGFKRDGKSGTFIIKICQTFKGFDKHQAVRQWTTRQIEQYSARGIYIQNKS